MEMDPSKFPLFTTMQEARKRADELQDQVYVLQAALRSWPEDSMVRRSSANIDFNHAMDNALTSGRAIEVVNHVLGKAQNPILAPLGVVFVFI